MCIAPHGTVSPCAHYATVADRRVANKLRARTENLPAAVCTRYQVSGHRRKVRMATRRYKVIMPVVLQRIAGSLAPVTAQVILVG